MIVPSEPVGESIGDHGPGPPNKGDVGALSAHLRLRVELMDAVRQLLRRRRLRQRDAAAMFGVAQPRVSDLVRGKIALFSIDTLVDMLAAAGVVVELKLRPPRPVPPSAPRDISTRGRRPRRVDSDVRK